MNFKVSRSQSKEKSHWIDLTNTDHGHIDITIHLTEGELRQIRDGIDAYLNSLPKSHVHAEKMMQYAKDATITEKPWELWESKWSFQEVEVWRNLTTHPSWDVGREYRRKPNAIVYKGEDSKEAIVYSREGL